MSSNIFKRILLTIELFGNRWILVAQKNSGTSIVNVVNFMNIMFSSNVNTEYLRGKRATTYLEGLESVGDWGRKIIGNI